MTGPETPPPAEESADRKAISGALMASGFPFQLAVRGLLQQNSWKVFEEEFPWRDSSGKDEFLDMIAIGPQMMQNTVIAAVECKKTTKESLVFLLPPENQTEVNIVNAVRASVIRDSNPRTKLEVGVFVMFPTTLESAFCVVSNSSGTSSERLLERSDVQKLVRATDAFAKAFRDRLTKAENHVVDQVFVPVLVTNAPIYVASFDPVEAVSLETGSFGIPPDAKPRSAIRFRKAFVSGAKGQPSERSVFVVNVSGLQEFLSRLGMGLNYDPNSFWRLD
jgi:hypothetical protein